MGSGNSSAVFGCWKEADKAETHHEPVSDDEGAAHPPSNEKTRRTFTPACSRHCVFCRRLMLRCQHHHYSWDEKKDVDDGHTDLVIPAQRQDGDDESLSSSASLSFPLSSYHKSHGATARVFETLCRRYPPLWDLAVEKCECGDGDDCPHVTQDWSEDEDAGISEGCSVTIKHNCLRGILLLSLQHALDSIQKSGGLRLRKTSSKTAPPLRDGCRPFPPLPKNSSITASFTRGVNKVSTAASASVGRQKRYSRSAADATAGAARVVDRDRGGFVSEDDDWGDDTFTCDNYNYRNLFVDHHGPLRREAQRLRLSYRRYPLNSEHHSHHNHCHHAHGEHHVKHKGDQSYEEEDPRARRRQQLFHHGDRCHIATGSRSSSCNGVGLPKDERMKKKGSGGGIRERDTVTGKGAGRVDCLAEEDPSQHNQVVTTAMEPTIITTAQMICPLPFLLPRSQDDDQLSTTNTHQSSLHGSTEDTNASSLTCSTAALHHSPRVARAQQREQLTSVGGSKNAESPDG